MARTVNEREYARKRDEILDTTMRLILAKGYERMTIQDIITDLRISSGAFYHYFDSKPAVLEAFVERILQGSQEPLLPIVHNPHLSAIEKLQGYFATLDRLRMEQRAAVTEVGRVWYRDENAIVRDKVEAAIIHQRVPLLTQIVGQGVQEGVFTTAYPDQAGEVVMSLLRGMENTHARLLLSYEKECDKPDLIERIVTTQAAYMEAVERVLGAPPNCLHRTDADAVTAWIAPETEDLA
jgi:AcrR family transcriptional regulator